LRRTQVEDEAGKIEVRVIGKSLEIRNADQTEASFPRHHQAEPSTRNTTVPMQKSMRFFMMMLPAFFRAGKAGFHHGEAAPA
jgi:hypothetical protein